MLQSAAPIVRNSAITLDFSKLRQTWAKIGLTTQPAERAAAEAAVKKAYQAAGLEAPGKVIWCASPFSQGLTRAIILHPEFLASVATSVWVNIQNHAGTNIKDEVIDSFKSSMRLFDTGMVKEKLRENVKNDVVARMKKHISEAMQEEIRISVIDSVWDSVWTSVWESTEESIWKAIDTGIRKAIKTQEKAAIDEAIAASLNESIGASVKSTVWDCVMEQAWTNIRNGAQSNIRVSAWKNLWEVLQKPIWDNIATRIGECLKACAHDSAQASGYGQHDAYWLSFYAYFREVEGLSQETEQITGLLDLAKSAGWYTPHAKVCWICERPNTLSLNQNGKLHSNDGQPALAYPDGWSVYANDGALRFSKTLQ